MWQAIGAIGSGLSGISNQQARNRGGKLSAQMDLEQILMGRDAQYFDQRLAREAEGRASGTDAWRKLLAADRLGSPGARPQLSPYSVAPRQATEREMAGAHGMAEEAIKRLMGGNPIAPVTERPLEVDRRLMDAGKWEKILGYVGAIMGGAGQLGGARRTPSFYEEGGGG